MISFKQTDQKRFKSRLKRVDRRLKKLHEKCSSVMAGLSEPDAIEALGHAVAEISVARQRIGTASLIDLTEALADAEVCLTSALATQPTHVFEGRLAILGAITAVDETAKEGANDANSMPDGADRQLLIQGEVFYQLRESLFPAERMVVFAGRRSSSRVSLTAAFDVTGEATSTGVAADPVRLGRALISMAETGAYLALWAHSHPGSGPQFARPSQTDTKQHADWIKDYSSCLVGCVVVQDGYLRMFGSAVEQGRIEIVTQGQGVSMEGTDGTLYKISA